RHGKLYDLHIRSDLRHHITLPAVGEIAEVKIHNVIKYRFAQVQQRVYAEVFHDPLRKITEQVTKENRSYNNDTDILQRFVWTDIIVELICIVSKPAADIIDTAGFLRHLHRRQLIVSRAFKQHL